MSARVACLLLTSALLSSCAAGLRPARYLDAAALTQVPADDEERFGDAPVVALQIHERYSIHTPTSEPIYTDIQRHVIKRVRSQKGIDEHASVRIWMDADTEILHFAARTISPRGEIAEVEPEQVYDAKATRGKHKASYVSFQFPRVEVGSVLEYTYTLRMESYYPVLERGAGRSYPVVDYQMEILAPKAVVYEARVHNTALGFRQEKVGTASRLLLSLRDLPARDSSDFAPHWTRYSPWWSFRIKHFAWRYNTYKVTHSWRDTFRHLAERIYTRDDDYFAGFGLAVDERCDDDVGCSVKSALDLLRERAELDGFTGSLFDISPARTVLSRGGANNVEKAVLLYALLADAGLDARFAVLPRRFTRTIDKRAPSSRPMNHALVYLPPQRGLDEELWLDPSCEWCAPGELPPWSRGVEALVLGFEKKAFQRKEGLAEWRTANGAPAPPTRQRYRYEASLDESGDVLVELTIDDFGAHAARRWLRTRGAERETLLRRAERRAKASLEAGQLLEHQPPTCDRARGHCEHRYRYRLPSFAGREGDVLFLPLGILDHPYDYRMVKKERDHDIFSEEEDEAVTELIVRAPPGWRLESPVPPPKRWAARSDLASFALASERTEDGFRVERTLRVSAGHYEKARYDELRAPLVRHAELATEVLRLVPPDGLKAE